MTYTPPPIRYLRCCACGQRNESVQNLIMLPWEAPVDGTGWGCKCCGLPDNGALAVVCDQCVAENRTPSRACFGPVNNNQRIKVSLLERRPFEHREGCGVGDLTGIAELLVCPEEIAALAR